MLLLNNQKEKNLFKRASENTCTFSRRVFRGEGVAAIENHLKLAALTFLESTDESGVGWQSGAPSKHDGKEEPQRANKIL